MHSIQRVRGIALAFRRALEEHGPESSVSSLRHFPRDSCADAVLLLGAYLFDKGIGPFEAVGGRFEDCLSGTWYSHAWLEREGVIVDITADQFPGMSEPVIVTRDPAWHRRFQTSNRGVADFRRYDPAASAQLRVVYDRICATLEANEKGGL
jgi:hypothetical protein